MKIKELFKKVEIANEVFEITGRSDELFYILLDYYSFNLYKFTTYNQFKKKIKDEFVPDFVKALNEIDFKIGKEFYINNTKLIFYVK